MEFTLYITLFHIIGVAVGVGGATVSDVLFFRVLKDRKISKDELALLHTLGYVLWAGLAILFLSGLGFVITQYLALGYSQYLASAWFQAKLTILSLLFLNALAMHWFVFPFLERNLDTTLTVKKIGSSMALLASTGVISIVSWYSVLTLGVTRGLDFPYGLIVNLYLVLLTFGMAAAYMILKLSVFADPLRLKTGADEAGHAKRNKKVTLKAISLGVGIVILGGLLAHSLIPHSHDHQEHALLIEQPEPDHTVCILETNPWFYPSLLDIKAGETVEWKVCDETPTVNLNFASEAINFTTVICPITQMATDEPILITFDAAGNFGYECADQSYSTPGGIIVTGETHSHN